MVRFNGSLSTQLNTCWRLSGKTWRVAFDSSSLRIDLQCNLFEYQCTRVRTWEWAHLLKSAAWWDDLDLWNFFSSHTHHRIYQKWWRSRNRWGIRPASSSRRPVEKMVLKNFCADVRSSFESSSKPNKHEKFYYSGLFAHPWNMFLLTM